MVQLLQICLILLTAALTVADTRFQIIQLFLKLCFCALDSLTVQTDLLQFILVLQEISSGSVVVDLGCILLQDQLLTDAAVLFDGLLLLLCLFPALLLLPQNPAHSLSLRLHFLFEIFHLTVASQKVIVVFISSTGHRTARI